MKIGIVGATGQVGGVMRRVLAEREVPGGRAAPVRLGPLGRARLPWQDAESRWRTPTTADYAGLDIVLFSAGKGASKQLAPQVAAAGAVVIDNSSAWRMDPDVPLVVAEVNPHAVAAPAQGHHRQPELHHDGRDAGARPAARARPGWCAWWPRTYQAVSGAGLAGVAELDSSSARGPSRGRS